MAGTAERSGRSSRGAFVLCASLRCSKVDPGFVVEVLEVEWPGYGAGHRPSRFSVQEMEEMQGVCCVGLWFAGGRSGRLRRDGVALAPDLVRLVLGAGPRPMVDHRPQIQLGGAGGSCGSATPPG